MLPAYALPDCRSLPIVQLDLLLSERRFFGFPSAERASKEDVPTRNWKKSSVWLVPVPIVQVHRANELQFRKGYDAKICSNRNDQKKRKPRTCASAEAASRWGYLILDQIYTVGIT